VKKIAVLRQLTEPLRPPLSGAARWRLVSHLALNHLSLNAHASSREPMRALDALREILKLYDFVDRDETRKRISAWSACARARSCGGSGAAPRPVSRAAARSI
jgi:type VI secretion system protein ImpG